MAETSEQDRQRDEAGREAIRRLSCPVKGRVMLAQAFTVLSALLSFAPYLGTVKKLSHFRLHFQIAVGFTALIVRRSSPLASIHPDIFVYPNLTRLCICIWP